MTEKGKTTTRLDFFFFYKIILFTQVKTSKDKNGFNLKEQRKGGRNKKRRTGKIESAKEKLKKIPKLQSWIL